MSHHDATVLGDAWWTDRYEAIRYQWLAPLTARVQGWSMTLLVQRGMAAWMQAWPKPTTSSLPPSPLATRRTLDCAPSLPSGVGQELATVMVSMILGRSKELAV